MATSGGEREDAGPGLLTKYIYATSDEASVFPLQIGKLFLDLFFSVQEIEMKMHFVIDY